MLNSPWFKTGFNRLMKATRPSRKQRNLAGEGRTLRLETLEPRRLLANWVFPKLDQGEIFHGDFEHPEGFQLEARTQGSRPGNIESPYITVRHFPGGGALPEVKNGSVVPDGAGARAGNSVFESEVKKQGAPEWYREEVVPRAKGITTPDVDYWYGFSTYFAQDYQPDFNYEIYSQWFIPGTTSGGPLMSLRTLADKNGVINHNTVTLFNSGGVGLIASVDLSDLKGKWTDWVVHARWSTSSSGIVEVFRDGQLIGAKNGRTIRSGEVTGEINGVPIQRLGIYKASWKESLQVPNAPAATEMTVYYDEWRIARSDNDTNLFDIVDPAQGNSNGGNTNGDFDLDGDTDGADFLQWQRDFGLTYDADDLTDWEEHYGDSAPINEVLIDFNQATISNYNAHGSTGNTVTVSSAGTTLTLDGDGWKSMPFNRTITANTVIEFDFQSPVEGDIHAIGFDNDDAAETNRTLRFHGTQNTVGISTVPQYTGSGVQHFKLRIGDYAAYELGNVDRLFFVNDHDAAPFNAVGIFSNVRIYDEATALATGSVGFNSEAEGVESPAFLLAAEMFSPVASQLPDDSVLDEAFADSGGSVSDLLEVLAVAQAAGLESSSSPTLAQEQPEEAEESETVAGSLELALELMS